MKIKKCPYCGKRISYISSYASRRKGEFVCERCNKESKVVIDKRVILLFIVMLIFAVAIMAVWIFMGFTNNPLGILLVAIPFVLFAILSPKFVRFEPLKKYKKSMEAKKAGIAYSDNLITSELEENEKFIFNTAASNENMSGNFQINSDVFNKIKAERTAARKKLVSDELISDSDSVGDKKINDDSEYISVIKNVSENHASTQAPLKKIHSENSIVKPVRRNHHFVSENDNISSSDSKKNERNRYSSNRKF